MSNELKEFIKELEAFNELMGRFNFLFNPEKEEGFVDTLKSLLRSRKVLLAAFGVVQTLVTYYLDIPTEVWASIDALVVVLIGAIAYEDAAEKSNG